MARSHSCASNAGEPEITRARGHIAADAALRVDHGVVVNGEMAGNAHLPGQQHVLLQNGAARQTGLRADDVVLAHHAGVADLHQAVDLRAALHARFAHGGAVHRGERLDLDVVLDHRHAGLHDLEVRAVARFGEAEAVAAHHDAVLQDHAVADAAEFAHHGVRVGAEIVADLRAFVDHHVRMQHGVAADGDVFADHGEGADGGAFADPRGWPRSTLADECRAAGAAAGRTGPARARNRDKDWPKSGWRAAVPASGSATRIAAARVCFTLGAYFGLARNVSSDGPGLLHPRHAGDFNVGIAPELAAEARGEIAERDSLDGGHKDGFIVPGRPRISRKANDFRDEL